MNCCLDKANGVSLDWQTRYHIISGVARGLLYLHHESWLRIIHRDFWCLDTDMNPKIFRLWHGKNFRREWNRSDHTQSSRNIVSTFCKHILLPKKLPSFRYDIYQLKFLDVVDTCLLNMQWTVSSPLNLMYLVLESWC